MTHRQKELHWGWLWLVCTVALSALCALVACAAPVKPAAVSPPIDPPASLALLVDNKSFYDANVYLLAHDAVVRRVGTVEGFSVRRFVLLGSMFAPGQSFALYAKTIGEGQEYHSGDVAIYAGVGFRWTLEGRGIEWLVPMSQVQ